MEISKTKAYTLISSTESIFDEFYSAFITNKLQEVDDHKVIELSENLNTTITNLSLFLSVADAHRKNGKSFVIVCTQIDIDDIPDEIAVVPTIIEAEDLMEMEAIERDLGF